MKSAERRTLISKLVKTMRVKDSWAGETHVQKCVLFLQDLTNVPLGYEFVLYKHGPYSFDLRNELAEMRARLYLDVEPRSGYGPSFTLGPWGKKAADKSHDYGDAVEFVCDEISTKDVQSLERISTAFFIQSEPENSTLDSVEVAKRVSEIKPHISIEEARDAVGEVAEIREKRSKTRIIH